MKTLPDSVIDFVRKKGESIEWGKITVEVTMTGYIDVVTEERTRFPAPERTNKYKDGGPKPGKIVVRTVEKRG